MGVVGFQTIWLSGQSMPSRSSSGRRFPLGSGGWPPPNGPPGGCFGTEGDSCGFTRERGVDEQERRLPFAHVRRQAVDLPLSQRGRLRDEQDVDVGWGSRSSGETEVTSYCFLSSVTIDHSSPGPCVRKSKPPSSLASVFRMPTFLRLLARRRESTASARTRPAGRGRRTARPPPRGPR